ncbi:MAG: LuxR C-terminal-related transcriptional regulator [Nocardioides sp.]|uniref:helix-turn-helix transcriptional regulator n=1 Tax=Nocardioides sp. TaxID=35761 RepID=UPI00326361BB
MVDIVPSDVASDTFTLGETRVLIDCAYVAGSGSTKEAAVEIFAQLQSLVHQDAAALLAWDPLAGRHVVIGNSAYDAATLVGLGEPYAQTDPHERMLEQRRPLRIGDLPYDYRKTELFQEILRPAGFGDGMSSCLFAGDGGYAGMLHMSAESRTAFASRHVQLISTLTASLGQLCNLRRLRSALLPVAEDSRASLIDHAGRPTLVDQYEPATCVDDADFCRFAERLLRTPSCALSGVWPLHGNWLAIRVERVRDPLVEHGAALLVIESPWEAPYGLSARELDVLNGIAQGASNQRIASERAISVRTVTTHVERILVKLGQESRAGAAAKATREGLLRLDLIPTAPALA